MADLYLKNEDFLRKKKIPLVLLRRDPQPEFPLHSHESSELVIVTRGTGKHILPGTERKISAGDVFLIHGKTRHAYSELQDLALNNIMFDLKEIEHPLFSLQGKSLLSSLFLLKVQDGGVHLDGIDFQSVLELVRRMEEEQLSGAEDSPSMIAALFMELILLLGRWAKSAGLIQKNTPYSRVDELIDEMTEHSSRKWCRAEMAKFAGMSLSTLTRHFRDRTGLAPLEYLIRIRLKKASILLHNPELDLAEIADMTGFSDSNYFCRLFRKHFGISPGKYRKTRS